MPGPVGGGGRDEPAHDRCGAAIGHAQVGVRAAVPGRRQEQRGGEEDGDHGPIVLPAPASGTASAAHRPADAPRGAWGGADAPAGRGPASC